MRTLDRYIFRSVLASVGAVLVALVAIFSFFALLDQLEDVGRGGYGILLAAGFVVASLPALAYQMTPLAGLMGGLVALGTLTGNNEIVVVRAAGVPLRRIVWSVLKAAFAVSLLALLVGEFVVPESARLAREIRAGALGDGQQLRNGFWARDGRSFVNIRRLLADGSVEGVHVYEFDAGDRLRMATRASRAEWSDGQWILHDIEQSEIGDDAVRSRHIDRAAWTSMLRPELVGMVVQDPERLSMLDLWRYVGFLEANAQDAQRHRQALAGKLVYPFAGAVMVFLAVPLVLGTRRDTNMGVRIATGTLIGLVFHIANQASGHIGVLYGASPLLAVSLPTLVALVVALVLLERVA